MAYNGVLVDRIGNYLLAKNIEFEEKYMFGGVCFMIDNKMCMGVIKDDMMARVHPEKEEHLLSEDGARPMDFSNRYMRGYLFIDSSAHKEDATLHFWINQCLEFNPFAKASKKKRKT